MSQQPHKCDASRVTLTGFNGILQFTMLITLLNVMLGELACSQSIADVKRDRVHTQTQSHTPPTKRREGEMDWACRSAQ